MKKEDNIVNLTISKVIHRKQTVLSVSFKYNKDIINYLKNTKQYTYSNTLRSWYTSYTIEHILQLKNDLKSKVNFNDDPSILHDILNSNFTKTSTALIESNSYLKYLEGKRYSKSTITTYGHLVAEYLENKPENRVVDLRSIELHVEEVLLKKDISISTHRQFISAMKHYLTFINSDIEIDFASLAPKRDKKLPNVLSHEEVIELIRVTKNIKHRICIAMIYSSGLRIGELINLRLNNLDFERKMLKVQSGKGRKDRYVPIANVILPLLQNYLNTYTPSTYLVEGAKEGVPYSAVSIRNFLVRSCKNANITKKVTPHTLRHSYATHLLENGTDIRYIQELLGHSRPETTMIYTHVRSQDLKNITNPLDLIVKQLEERKKIN